MGITYNRTTDKFLTLDDALTLTGISLTDLSKITQKQLTEQFGEIMFADGISPTADNFSTFTVSKKSIDFTLQEYQAEPYAAGMPEIIVPRVR